MSIVPRAAAKTSTGRGRATIPQASLLNLGTAVLPEILHKTREWTLSQLVAALRESSDQNWPRSDTVGNTPQLRARHLEERFRNELKNRHGIKFTGRIWLKHEGANCTSTHKDRALMRHAARAVALGKKEITIASCGNAGEALAVAAALYGLTCTIFIPRAYAKDCPQVIKRMQLCGASVVFTDGDYDDAVRRSEAHAKKRGIYDANSSGPNLCVEHEGFAVIPDESANQLLSEGPEVKTPVTAYAVPLGNGALFSGVFSGIRTCLQKRTLSHMPQMIGGTCQKNNPILDAFRHQQRCTEAMESCQVTAATAALATRDPCDSVGALDAIRCSGGAVYHVDDAILTEMCDWIREGNSNTGWNLDPLEAGVAGLAALFKGLAKGKIDPHGTYVAIISGVKD